MTGSTGGFGERIEDYHVGSMLGKGGFAEVYKARCKISNTEVAIKMINVRLMYENNMADRVRQEVSIHSTLKHPSILEVYTFFQDQNYVYLVLELCHNGSLQRYLQQQPHRALSEQDAGRIFMQIVEGLLYLHKHRIIHRDLSLSNVLLTKDMQVKIADFGLATKLESPDEKHLTMCGTPNFISPEVATRSSHGLEVDIWSLGCMLYTLLVGRPPFDSDAVKSTLTNVVKSDYYIPSRTSENARDLIGRMLKKNAKERISLREILQHPFVKSIEKKQSNKLSFVRSGGSTDSGVGRTMSSCSRPRSRERLAGRSRPLATNVSVKSEPISHLSRVPSSHKNYRSKDSGVLSSSHSLEFLKHKENFLSRKSTHESRAEMNAQTNEPLIGKLPVPPLSTLRLHPIRHKTRRAVFTILSSGELCVEFFKKQDNKEKISEVLRISNDGDIIVMYKPTETQEIAEKPIPMPPRGSHSIYSYENLPTKFYRKYVYAARFVSLVRAQTPKVTYYSDYAKCVLMENTPQPDCETSFYNGIKVCLIQGKVKITDQGGKSYSKNNIPAHLKEFYHHFKKCYKHCLDEAAHHEASEKTTGVTDFPLIMGKRPEGASENVPLITPSVMGTHSMASTTSYTSKRSNSVRQQPTIVSKVKKCIPGIGIATKSPAGHIKVQYDDGTTLTVSPSNNEIIFESRTGGIQRFNQNKCRHEDLPEVVQNKLANFSSVTKVFEQAPHRNIRC